MIVIMALMITKKISTVVALLILSLCICIIGGVPALGVDADGKKDRFPGYGSRGRRNEAVCQYHDRSLCKMDWQYIPVHGWKKQKNLEPISYGISVK